MCEQFAPVHQGAENFNCTSPTTIFTSHLQTSSSVYRGTEVTVNCVYSIESLSLVEEM